MKPDPLALGRPKCGTTGAFLGARADEDIPVNADGGVLPKTGGMSTVVDDWKKLPSHRKPEALGGESEDHHVYAMAESEFPTCLAVRQDSPKHRPHHRVVEPANACPFTQYLADLHATQHSWCLVT